MASQSPQVSFRCEDDLKDAIHSAALDDERSDSDWIRLVLIKILEDNGYLEPRVRRPGKPPQDGSISSRLTSKAEDVLAQLA